MSAHHLTNSEICSLRNRFRRVFQDKKAISKTEFLSALQWRKLDEPQPQATTSLFVADRLFDIFAAHSKTPNGLDFEAFASLVSTFSGNAPVEEKMFVCFKVFDVDNQNYITYRNLLNIVSTVFASSHVQITRPQLAHCVATTFKAANSRSVITFDQFKVLFVRCRRMFDSWTIGTWRLIDDLSNLDQMKVFLFSKLRALPSTTDEVRFKNGPLQQNYSNTVCASSLMHTSSAASLRAQHSRSFAKLQTQTPPTELILTEVAAALLTPAQRQQINRSDSLPRRRNSDVSNSSPYNSDDEDKPTTKLSKYQQSSANNDIPRKSKKKRRNSKKSLHNMDSHFTTSEPVIGSRYGNHVTASSLPLMVFVESPDDHLVDLGPISRAFEPAHSRPLSHQNSVRSESSKHSVAASETGSPLDTPLPSVTETEPIVRIRGSRKTRSEGSIRTKPIPAVVIVPLNANTTSG